MNKCEKDEDEEKKDNKKEKRNYDKILPKRCNLCKSFFMNKKDMLQKLKMEKLRKIKIKM